MAAAGRAAPRWKNRARPRLAGHPLAPSPRRPRHHQHPVELRFRRQPHRDADIQRRQRPGLQHLGAGDHRQHLARRERGLCALGHRCDDGCGGGRRREACKPAAAHGRASACEGMQVVCVPRAHNPCAFAGLPPALRLDPSPSVRCAAETPTRSLVGYGQRVAIGGNWTDWVGSQCGGITLLGTFGSRAAGDGSTNSPPATSNETPPLFVFPQRLNNDVKARGWWEGRGVGLGGLGLGPQALHFISHRKARGPHPPPQFIWEVVSHEVGHAFGLV